MQHQNSTMNTTYPVTLLEKERRIRWLCCWKQAAGLIQTVLLVHSSAEGCCTIKSSRIYSKRVFVKTDDLNTTSHIKWLRMCWFPSVCWGKAFFNTMFDVYHCQQIPEKDQTQRMLLLNNPYFHCCLNCFTYNQPNVDQRATENSSH